MTNQQRAAEVLAKFMAAQNLATAQAPLTNEQKISGRILTEVSKGTELKVAIDKVLGRGSFDRIVDMVYEGARA